MSDRAHCQHCYRDIETGELALIWEIRKLIEDVPGVAMLDELPGLLRERLSKASASPARPDAGQGK